MNSLEFKAIKICNELNLNEISEYFGINKKFKWEDILVLNSQHLKGIINQSEEKSVHLFSFGSIVSINMQIHEMNDVLEYIKKISSDISISFSYIEEYRLEVNPDIDVEFDNDKMTVQKYKHQYCEITSTVLAKSVALTSMEKEMDGVFDKVENVINFLNKGKFNMKDKELAKISSTILGFKYNSLSYLMLLDKPQIAWDDAEAGEIFQGLTKVFEMSERYERIKHKTETLMDVTEVFATISHANRGSRLEWIVIILFIIDIIVIVLFDILRIPIIN
jgi:uncharacterized Rmd1/YagE family protein